MSDLVEIGSVELIPVVEVSAFRFSTRERALPERSVVEMPDAWHRFWLASLADAGITDLEPVYSGSPYVTVRVLGASDALGKVLTGFIRERGGIEALGKPRSAPVLDGGLILRSADGSILVEPGCCSDMGDLSSWRAAADHRRYEWEMVWVGHPWVSVRYDAPWLQLSEPHEMDNPVGRWALSPAILKQAIADAKSLSEK